MTFEKQLKEAKTKQLQYRIIRDVIFLIIGITFLLISIISSINDKNKDSKANKTTTKNAITTTKK